VGKGTAEKPYQVYLSEGSSMTDKIPAIEQLIEDTARGMDINCTLCSFAISPDINSCGFPGEINLCNRRMEVARTLLSQDNLYVRVYSETYINLKEYLEEHNGK
jgi:hypothetical protein